LNLTFYEYSGRSEAKNPEKMVEIMSRGRIFIGLHGATFTHMIMARPVRTSSLNAEQIII
jgi:hypothetical protein